MPTQIKLTGFDNLGKEIIAIAKQSLPEVETYTEKYLYGMLDSQIDASGNPFPKKAPSTIKQYEKQGWNTKDYLIRTGQSKQLITRRVADGFTIEPKGANILKQFVGPDKIDWMAFNNKAIKDITNIFYKQLKKDLK